MSKEPFDPVKSGQSDAATNAALDAEATSATPNEIGSTITDAQKLAKKNAKIDKSNTTVATMNEVPVATADVDIPEGEPVTDGEEPKAPEVSAPVEHGHESDEPKSVAADKK